MRRWSLTARPAVMALGRRPACAQFGPGGGGMRPGGAGAARPQPAGEEKEEGPAEAAPEEKGESPALQPLPAWPQQKEKPLQFFQLNGYIRFRAYLFHNLNLGFCAAATSGPQVAVLHPATPSSARRAGQSGRRRHQPAVELRRAQQGQLPHRQPHLGRHAPAPRADHQRHRAGARQGADRHLRQPGARLDARGLLPQRRRAPHRRAARRRSRARRSRRSAGVNSVYDSIHVKRAWAEVRTPFGELRFGRMPSHWGIGMLVNNGDCLDCDYGINADRVMFATKLWGHFIAFLWDWVATGPTTQIIGPQQRPGRPFYNADTLDDVSQWILALGKHGQARGAEGEARPGQDRLQLRRLLRLPPAGLGRDRPTRRSAVEQRPDRSCRTTLRAAPAPRRSSPTSGCASTGRSCTSRPKAR